MNASLLVPLAFLVTLLVSAVVAGFGWRMWWRTAGNRHWLVALITGVVLLTINSWWLLLGAMVFIKFVILQEDT